MVVLAVAISTKEGKMLVSRHFGDISMSKVEDCVKILPKLINSEQQHTYVEHNNLRLIYLPFNNMYLQAISEKNSNILEDIEILRQLHSINLAILKDGPDEKNVCDMAIDIIFAIDDVITNGNRNSVSQSLVLTALTMDSNNEKMHNLVMKNKEQLAKEKAYEYLHKLESNQGVSSLEGFTSESMIPSQSNTNNTTNEFPSSLDDVPFKKADHITDTLFNDVYQSEASKISQKAVKVTAKKGLQLGKKKKPAKESPKLDKSEKNESSAKNSSQKNKPNPAD